MKSRTTIIVLLVLVLLLTACSPAGNGGEEPVQLDGTRWELLAMNGEAPIEGTTITAEFADDEISGNSGCNSYFGSYTLEGNTITFGMLGMTEMACLEPEGVMAQESAYLETLRSVTGVRLTGVELEMMDASGTVVLRFGEPEGSGTPVDTASLEGTMWTLESFVQGETVTSLIAGTTITLQLDAGRMTGSAGCNNYGGSYTLEDGELTVNELVWTEMACMDPEGVMEQEERYLSILNNATRLELEGGQLTLRTPDGRGLVFVPNS
jgi:heat shock protein HslJ